MLLEAVGQFYCAEADGVWGDIEAWCLSRMPTWRVDSALNLNSSSLRAFEGCNMAGQRRSTKAGKRAKRTVGDLVTGCRHRVGSVFTAIVVLGVIAIVFLGVFTDKTIQFGLKDGWPYVRTEARRRPDPEPQETRPVDLKHSQQVRDKQLLDEQSERLRALELEVRELRKQQVRYEVSVWNCCSVIARELAQSVSIDTERPCKDEHDRKTYVCIQRLLSVLGHYHGDLDGDQGRTNLGLKALQGAENLTVDGKLGRQTWRAMLCGIAETIIGDDSS